MEVNLQDVVQLTNLGAHMAEQTLVQGVTEQDGTGGGCGHAEKVSEASVFVLAGLIHINQSAAGAGSADDRNGKSAEENERRSLGQGFFGDQGVFLLGALAASHGNRGKTEEVVVAVVSGGVEEVIFTDEEDGGKLFVVVGHHDVLGRALAEAQQGVNVLNAAESLLPQLKLDSDIQLLEAGVEVTLQSVGIAKVDGMHLRRVFGGILDVITEKLAETTELGLAGVLLAELEGLQSSRLIHNLEASIVLKNLEDGAVGLPEELQPGGDNSTVGTITRLFTGDGCK